MSHSTKGTKEWGHRNLNLQERCPNDCDYCYAKRMALRFKRIQNAEEWGLHPIIKTHKVQKGYRKLNNPSKGLYDYMFPTSHDILPENLFYCIKVLKKVLKAGNSVLITTKADPFCIKKICKELRDYKDLTCFRFTITSATESILREYERHAPSFRMRYDALVHAYYKGFKTSLSIEPLLDPSPLPVIDRCQGYVTDTIWIGKMSGKIPDELKEIYTQENLKLIYMECKDLPRGVKDKLRWKDSIVNALGLEANYF